MDYLSDVGGELRHFYAGVSQGFRSEYFNLLELQIYDVRYLFSIVSLENNSPLPHSR